MTRFINDKGFNLVELMIASGILLIVLSGLMVTFVYGILLNESNNNLVIATNDAQYVLEQIKGLAYSAISSYPAPTFYNLNNETITLSRSIGTRIAEVTVDVSWTERQRQRSFRLSTRIAS
jgi:prepilin-type N-terminal cleavage/methylation domain-containing protein